MDEISSEMKERTTNEEGHREKRKVSVVSQSPMLLYLLQQDKQPNKKKLIIVDEESDEEGNGESPAPKLRRSNPSKNTSVESPIEENTTGKASKRKPTKSKFVGCDVPVDSMTACQPEKEVRIVYEVEKSNYECKFADCEFIPGTKESYEDHMHEGQTFNCKHCEDAFVYPRSLINHVLFDHKEVWENVCCICDKIFLDKWTVQLHHLTHTGEKPHSCSMCDKAYAASSSLKIHMINKHGGIKIHKCDKCPLSFARHDKLISHQRVHVEDAVDLNWKKCEHIVPSYKTNELLFTCAHCNYTSVCTFCGYSFDNQLKFSKHTHENLCLQCGVKYFNKISYKKHMEYHKKNVRYKCESCQFGFGEQLAYNIHNSKQHRVSAPPKVTDPNGLICTECGDKFTTVVRLQSHKRNHLEKNFKCPESGCTAAYGTTTLLKYHSRKHLAVKPFKCDICNKEFTRKTDLNRHLNTHNDLKPFPCELCDVSLKSKRNLLLHLKSHSKEKSFKCDTCDKKFSHKCYLNLHMKLHDEKPIKCQFPNCKKSFLKKQGLEQHMVSHT